MGVGVASQAPSYLTANGSWSDLLTVMSLHCLQQPQQMRLFAMQVAGMAFRNGQLLQTYVLKSEQKPGPGHNATLKACGSLEY